MKGILEPYVEFNGNAKEAFDFYQKVFNTEEPFIMLGKDAPPDDEMEGFDPELVLHGSIRIGDILLMGSDTFTGDYTEPSGIYLSWASETAEDVEQVWKAFIDAGSEVIMEFEKTFWSEKYGILRDPYGVPWMIQVYEEMEAQ